MDLLKEVKKLVKIRRTSHALSEGGLRWVLQEDDSIGFLRESSKERLLVIAARSKSRLKLGNLVEKSEALYGPTLRKDKFISNGPGFGIYRLL